MQKICFLIGDISHSGGTERVTTLIANQMAKDNKIYILSLSGNSPPFFEQNSSIINDSLFNKKVSMKKKLLSTILKIRKYLITNKIDTLIVVDSISCVFTVPACIGLKLQHICWEHFNLKVNLGSSFRDLGRWMAAKFCNKIITLTERDKRFWDTKYNLISSNKVIAIPNPSPYNLQDNQPTLANKTILCVGRLTYQKGFDLLIPAWADIASKLNGWKVIIVGTGEDENILKEMAIEYNVSDSIKFVGQQKNMDLFYRKASFFCMSSRFEGLPMVLLEAQSYGLPIVSFDCDTGPGEIICDSSNGFLCSKENINELSRDLFRLADLESLKFNEFTEKSKKKSLEYDISNIINKWNSIGILKK